MLLFIAMLGFRMQAGNLRFNTSHVTLYPGRGLGHAAF